MLSNIDFVRDDNAVQSSGSSGKASQEKAERLAATPAAAVVERLSSVKNLAENDKLSAFSPTLQI
jgi:hypothetical protein